MAGKAPCTARGQLPLDRVHAAAAGAALGSGMCFGPPRSREGDRAPGAFPSHFYCPPMPSRAVYVMAKSRTLRGVQLRAVYSLLAIRDGQHFYLSSPFSATSNRTRHMILLASLVRGRSQPVRRKMYFTGHISPNHGLCPAGRNSDYNTGRRRAGKGGSNLGAESNTCVITPDSTKTTCGVRMPMARGLKVVSVDTKNGNVALLTRRRSRDS